MFRLLAVRNKQTQNKMLFLPFIHPSIFSKNSVLLMDAVDLELPPGTPSSRPGYTLDGTPIHHACTDTHVPEGKFWGANPPTSIFSRGGMKPTQENNEITHNNPGLGPNPVAVKPKKMLFVGENYLFSRLAM